MDRDDFVSRLERATTLAVHRARHYVTNTLPDDVLFDVRLNQSYDGHPLVGDEQVFPGEHLHFEGRGIAIASDRVVAALWRDGKVPEWIDVNARSVEAGSTIVCLRCCGRFTASEDLLYHRGEGYPPFHVLSPQLPPGWHEGAGKFEIDWQRTRGGR